MTADKPWNLTRLKGDTEHHVWPMRDLVDHVLVEDTCVCGPALDIIPTPDGDCHQYIHHSLDGREADE